MEKMNFEQMEQVQGGSTYGWVCGGLFTGWGLVLMACGPAGMAVGAVWSVGGYIICNLY